MVISQVDKKNTSSLQPLWLHSNIIGHPPRPNFNIYSLLHRQLPIIDLSIRDPIIARM